MMSGIHGFLALSHLQPTKICKIRKKLRVKLHFPCSKMTASILQLRKPQCSKTTDTVLVPTLRSESSFLGSQSSGVFILPHL